MRQCRRCGGELTPYALQCSWCGRSTFVSAFFQVATLAVLTLGGLFVAGVLPRDRLEAYLPFLRDDARSTGAAVVPASEASEGAGTGAVPGGYGSPSVASGTAEPVVREAAAPRPPAAPARQRCDDPATVHRLGSRYRSWSREDLALIACGRVRRGFTVGQVRAARGEPQSIEQPSAGVEVWSYSTGDVTFVAGVVATAE